MVNFFTPNKLTPAQSEAIKTPINKLVPATRTACANISLQYVLPASVPQLSDSTKPHRNPVDRHLLSHLLRPCADGCFTSAHSALPERLGLAG